VRLAGAPRARRTGARIARVLTGSWLSTPPPLPTEITDDELTRLWPLIAGSGAIGLLWRRLQSGARPPLPGIEELYFHQLLESRRQEQETIRVVTALKSAGIRPLLIKGWSVARQYPQPGLRPYTDVDLVVRPNERAQTVAVLERLSPLIVSFDLHEGVFHGRSRAPDTLLRRLQPAALGSVEVDLLGPEDELRLLCLHLLDHGAERMIWLCDLALLLERGRTQLDWDYLLAGDPKDSDAVLCALAIASRVLGVSLEGTPAAPRAQRLPGWAVDCVFESWGNGYRPHGQLGGLPRSPRALLQAARERWPNPIAATAWMRAPYNDFPRAPIQLAEYLRRAVSLVRRISG
jgi:hypothetical protein